MIHHQGRQPDALVRSLPYPITMSERPSDAEGQGAAPVWRGEKMVSAGILLQLEGLCSLMEF